MGTVKIVCCKKQNLKKLIAKCQEKIFARQIGDYIEKKRIKHVLDFSFIFFSHVVLCVILIKCENMNIRIA